MENTKVVLRGEIMNRRYKGFTLIELVISLGILAVILSLIFTFFMSNQKSMNKTEVKSSLQEEAQIILDYFNKSGMQAQKISVISGSEDLLSKNTSNVSVQNITFALDDGTEYAFNLNTSTNELYYSRQAITNKKIGSYVKDIKASILNGNSSTFYNNCSAIKLVITLSKKGVNNEAFDYEVTTNIYFRNK